MTEISLFISKKRKKKALSDSIVIYVVSDKSIEGVIF